MGDTSFIPYTRHTLDEDDVAAVVTVLRSDALTQGPNIERFEQAVARRVGARHAVAVSSGTAGLHLACLAAGLGPGDEAIVPPITFAATGNGALYCGADVRFADIRADSLTMDPAAAARAVTASTKAILPVDFTGQPADLDDIRDLADRHGLIVIQDAAHSLGATYKSRPMGTLAHMTVFSFHPAKHVAMGEGGAVVTDDDRLADRLRLLRTHGIAHAPDAMVLADQAADNEALPETRRNPAGKAPWYYEMQALGYNYRSTDIQCALGLSQLGKLDASLKRRVEIAQAYDRAFAGHPLIRLPTRLDDRASAWHLYVIMLNLEAMSVSRRQVLETLRAQGIGAHVHYIPLHLQPYYRDRFGHQRGDFPVAERYYDTCVTLPMFPALTDADVERVIASVLATVR